MERCFPAPCSIYSLKAGKRVPRRPFIGVMIASLLPVAIYIISQLPICLPYSDKGSILVLYLPAFLSAASFVFLGSRLANR